MRYKSLNDASLVNDFYAPGDIRIWHSKIEFFRDFIAGPEFVRKYGKMPCSVEELYRTHVLIGSMAGDSTIEWGEQQLHMVYRNMQGERWSPEGQALDLICSLDTHTSMSVGDVIQKGDDYYMVADGFGFEKLDIT